MDQDHSRTTIPTQETGPVEDSIKQLPAGSPVKSGAKSWPIVVGALILLALVGGIVALLMLTGAENVGKIRDVFIIFMALESFIIGVVLVILIVQISVLINLIQNEIKPILKTTNETISTLKGTTTFISDNLAEPVIKVNEFVAGLKKLIDLLFPTRK